MDALFNQSKSLLHISIHYQSLKLFILIFLLKTRFIRTLGENIRIYKKSTSYIEALMSID
jgi:hypothetical protein